MSSIESSKILEIAQNYLDDNYNIEGLKLELGKKNIKSFTFIINCERVGMVKENVGIIIVAVSSREVVFATPERIVLSSIRNWYDVGDLLNINGGSSFGWD